MMWEEMEIFSLIRNRADSLLLFKLLILISLSLSPSVSVYVSVSLCLSQPSFSDGSPAGPQLMGVKSDGSSSDNSRTTKHRAQAPLSRLLLCWMFGWMNPSMWPKQPFLTSDHNNPEALWPRACWISKLDALRVSFVWARVLKVETQL